MDLSELGGFLRSRRDRIRPQDVGLVRGPRRRVPGLRRDEVAHLAGVSTDYYIELERGAAQPSAQIVAALARALRLTLDERDHLFHLARRPVPLPGTAASHVHPSMLDLLGRLAGTPAQVITDLHVTLVQNEMARALLGPPVQASGYRASLVWRWFRSPDTRDMYPVADHDYQSRTLVADLRAAAGRRASSEDDAAEMVDDLLEHSAEFADIWQQYEVAVRRSDSKRIIHPAVGVIEVNCLNLFSEDGRQRLLWFTPTLDSDATEKMELLGAIGSQNLTS